MDYHKQRVISLEAAGAIALASEIQAAVGTTHILALKPTTFVPRFLVMAADKGNWRVRVGDWTGEGDPDEFPASSITDGTSALLIAEGRSLVIPAPDAVTLKGYAADSVLTYYWV